MEEVVILQRMVQGFFGVIMVVLTVLLLGTDIHTAQAHFLSCAEEYGIGEQSTAFYEAQSFPVEENPAMDSLQEEIIQSNHDELNGILDRGDRKRWLAPVRISYEQTINAFSFPGGFTYITNDMLNFLMGVADDGRPNGLVKNDWQKGYNFYTRGTVAFVLAHEFGHYANEDYLRMYDKQYASNLLFSVFGAKTGETQQLIKKEAKKLIDRLNTRQMSLRTEEQADQKALRYMENMKFYSIGNGAIFFSRLEKLESAHHVKQPWLTPHSETAIRLQRVLEHMQKISDGRIEFRENRLYLDGQLFNGTGLLPVKADVTAQDRTYFVAGKIAEAMKRGLWNPANAELLVCPKNEFWPNLEDNGEVLLFLQDKRDAGNVMALDILKISMAHFNKKQPFTPAEQSEKAYIQFLLHHFVAKPAS